MSDDKLTIQLLEELRKSNNSMQELKQLIPRLEKMEYNQERLYNRFLVHEALMKPEDFKVLAERVNEHDKTISLIQSELGISQKQIKEQKDSIKGFFNRVWDVLHKLIAPGGILYLILESKGVI